MPVQYTVTRTDMPAPDLSDPNRRLKVITYRAGQLPPRNLYMAAGEWTQAKEDALIKADVEKRMQLPGEIKSV